MMVDTAAGAVHMIEDGIPPELLPRARAWFAREVATLQRVHGPHWPTHREWLLDYLRAELRELVQAEVGKHVV